MAYVRTNWIDDVTPLDADHLNNIEDGVEEAKAALNVDSSVLDLYEDLGWTPEEE
jgi:hypothetical protein